MSDSGVGIIPLTRGFVALVDAKDIPLVSGSLWLAHESSRGRIYAARNAPGRGIIYLHRVIGCAPRLDHINGDTLDCRRVNLRPATVIENNRNSAAKHARRVSPMPSRFKGVSWEKRRHAWVAYIGEGGRHHYLGLHKDEEAAARAYDAAAIDRYGEFARLNFPEVQHGT